MENDTIAMSVSGTRVNKNTQVLRVSDATGGTPRTVVRTSKPNSPVERFYYNGKTYVTGLFKLHDTHGFPLSFSLSLCQENGEIPCVEQFVLDAMAAGWTRERAERTLAEGIADSSWRPSNKVKYVK